MNLKVWALTLTSAIVGFDLRHVARHALAPGAPRFVVRVRLERRRARTVGRQRAVAVQADLVGRFAELRVV